MHEEVVPKAEVTYGFKEGRQGSEIVNYLARWSGVAAAVFSNPALVERTLGSSSDYEYRHFRLTPDLDRVLLGRRRLGDNILTIQTLDGPDTTSDALNSIRQLIFRLSNDNPLGLIPTKMITAPQSTNEAIIKPGGSPIWGVSEIVVSLMQLAEETPFDLRKEGRRREDFRLRVAGVDQGMKTEFSLHIKVADGEAGFNVDPDKYDRALGYMKILDAAVVSVGDYNTKLKNGQELLT